jgi:hypothetical protein
MIRRSLTIFPALLIGWTTYAQGLVNFFNPSMNFVTAGPVAQETPISGPADSYYFGLLIAPPGTMDSSQFTFTGVYATNLATGRLYGGTSVPVPGWSPGTTESFLIAGWSASLGHDWNIQWQSGIFSFAGSFGVSSIGTGVSGGVGVPTSPALDLFGGPNSPTGIQTGWNLAPVSAVPEPLPLSLALLGTLIFILERERNETNFPLNKTLQATPVCVFLWVLS